MLQEQYFYMSGFFYRGKEVEKKVWHEAYIYLSSRHPSRFCRLHG